MIAPATSQPTPAPNSLDDAKRRTICTLISRGCSVRQAAHYVGCALSTVRHERDTNDRFRLKLAQAKVKHELAPLRALQRAMKKDWRAIAWFLERTQPEKFGRKNQRAFTQKQANALIKDVTSIIGEESISKGKFDRTSSRVEAAIRYAFNAHNDMNRTAAEMGRAMKHHDWKSPRYSPTLADFPPYEPLASSASSNRPPRTPGSTDCRPNVFPKPTSSPRPIVGAAQPQEAVRTTAAGNSSPPTGRTIAQMIVDTVDKHFASAPHQTPPPLNTTSSPLASSASSNLPPTKPAVRFREVFDYEGPPRDFDFCMPESPPNSQLTPAARDKPESPSPPQ